MMNEYRKMSSEELVQAAGGLDAKVSLGCQAVLDKDYGKAVDTLQSGLIAFRSNSKSICNDAKDKIGQLCNSDAVQNVRDAAVTQARSLTGRLFPSAQRS